MLGRLVSMSMNVDYEPQGDDERNDGVLTSYVRQLADVGSASDRSDMVLLNDLIGSNELPMLKSCSETKHSLFRGVDLDILYDDHEDTHMVYLDTYTKGLFEVFVLTTTNELTVLHPKKRFSLPYEGRPTFIRSTCLSRFPRSCNGCIISFEEKIGRSWSKTYKFGIIEALRYFQDDGSNHTIEFWEYLGAQGCVFENCEDWLSLLPHVTKRKVNMKKIRFFFLNQICGTVPFGGSICPSTRSSVDGGIQCSRNGPDVWPVPFAEYKGGMSKSFMHFPLHAETTCHPDLLVQNGTYTKPKRRKRMKSLLKNEEGVHPDVLKYLKPPKLIPDKDQQGLVLVVTNLDGSPLSKDTSCVVPSVLDKSICFGSMKSVQDSHGHVQKFMCLSVEEYDRLSSKYPDGLLLENDNVEEQIDSVLSSYSHGEYFALSVDKITTQEMLEGGKFHYFTRIFAGDASPTIDDTFSVSEPVGEIITHFKLVNAREYSAYSPLSVGFFNSDTHGVEIQPFYLPILKKALGSKGTYIGGRSVMAHTGELSYIGPRKNGAMRQPTIAEGPNDNSISPEHKFWYHRKFISHSYWPFAQHFINFIVGKTTLAAYHLYPFMAKLFPVSNSCEFRKKFCPRGIVAIDFSSSCHVDCGDNERSSLNSMKGRLENIILGFSSLRSKGIDILSTMVEEAQNALDHISWWGVCLPTTCCYQYVKTRNDIQVYQYFMCPGLGTVYRIKNYWVHLFMASLFSHCTSAAIYVVNGRAYFGTCPHAVMFSWGGN